MNKMLLYSVFLPFILAGICFIVPRRIKGAKAIIALLGTLAGLVLSLQIFLAKGLSWTSSAGLFNQLLQMDFFLKAGNFSQLILIFTSLFAFLITLYSLRFMQEDRPNAYYAYLLITLGAANGAVLSGNLIYFLIFWDIILLTMYAMIGLGKGAWVAAKKSLLIIGGADFLLLLGIIFVWKLTGTLNMDAIARTPLGNGSWLPFFAFLFMACGALAKAGSMPFHTWIPDAAKVAPVTVMALFPASLDKLLGIYLLACLTLNLFIITPGLGIFLMFIGAFTIIAAVLMALVQHDLKKLLSYHAVSQVGYMVLGIGTGNPIGIAGGIFHMLNHAIYKSCLFLGGGAVEHRTKTTDLAKLGGLAKFMPITFIATLIASLSISGVPPFNGFVSKWMVYQGVIQATQKYSQFQGLIWIFLVAALFGSALTLASFMKLIHSTFLGTKKVAASGQEFPVKEVSPSMSFPLIVLAGLCVFFGVFAYVPLKYLIGPIVGMKFVSGQAISLSGIWSPTLATGLILIGLILGCFIYLLGKAHKPRRDEAYAGGEIMSAEFRFPGTHFYNTVEEMKGLRGIYKAAEKKFFDFYEWGLGFFKAIACILYYCVDRFIDWLVMGVSQIALGLSSVLRAGHIGVLPIYLTWSMIGFGIILYVLIR